MSRSNPTPQNPAEKFFRWSGSKGKLTYWDKAEEKEIEVKFPFTFLVLDELATITGFCEPDSSSYWSNEVRSMNEEFTVKTSAGTKEVGLYRNLTDVRSKGAKYAKSIYVSFLEGDAWHMGNIKASGAALTAWIEFGKKVLPMGGKCSITGAEKAKKGTNEYYVPTFGYDRYDEEENQIAIELDKELQAYLGQYLSKHPESEEESLLSTEEQILGAEDHPLLTLEQIDEG